MALLYKLLDQNLIKLKYISVVFFLIVFSFDSIASTETEKNNEKDQEEKAEIEPSLEEEQQNGGSQELTVVDVDTTESSFEKFNYIFYFIYEFKYENHPDFSNPVPVELSTD